MIHTLWLNLILITVFQFSMFGFHYPKVDKLLRNLYKFYTNWVFRGILKLWKYLSTLEVKFMNKTNGHNIVIDWNFN